MPVSDSSDHHEPDSRVEPGDREIIYICEPTICCDLAWEKAYLSFESIPQEIAKFRRRLCRLGANNWDKNLRIVELFCGRGSALHAWEQLGFKHLEGVDLSDRLLAQYQGCAQRFVCDARELPFNDLSRDVVSVQGGLHHLEQLPEDLDRTLEAAARVLKVGGLLVAVEPWPTTFLHMVHAASEIAFVRKLSIRVDAFATMVELERATYMAWLQNPDLIVASLQRYFEPISVRIGFGKIEFLGRKR